MNSPHHITPEFVNSVSEISPELIEACERSLKRPIPVEIGSTYKKRKMVPTIVDIDNAEKDDFAIMDKKFYESRGWEEKMKEYDDHLFRKEHNCLYIKTFPHFKNGVDLHAYKHACYGLCKLANEWTTEVECAHCQSVLECFPSVFHGTIKVDRRHCFMCALDQKDPKIKKFFYTRCDYWTSYMTRLKKKGDPMTISYDAFYH
jgi:hypothetical protein